MNGASSHASSCHPRLLATAADHRAIRLKIESARWAKVQFDKVRSEMDRFVERAAVEPNWLTSRLAMNWQTHFRTPVVKNARLLGGDGRAPRPTPRFAGARNWVTPFSLPKKLEDLRPFNDDAEGRICLMSSKAEAYEWTDPARTGRAVEIINQRIMTVAARAAFLSWVTGEHAYARFAADLLWTYMDGFSFVTAPKIEISDDDTANVIGMTSFEVIHEDIVTPLSLAYDFLPGVLESAGHDPRVVQDGLKRIIDRVIEGGDGAGNWNLNQARIIAYGGLVLEDDASYPDGRGRQHYADVVLRARLPRQTGILHVIERELDRESGLWPEVPAYGFRAIQDLLHIATLVGDVAGRSVLDSPLLKVAVVAQNEMVYPNGVSIGLGDSDQAQFDTVAAELAIAAARTSGDTAIEERLASILDAKIADRSYVRGTHGDVVLALTKFVHEHRAPPDAQRVQPRTFYAKPLNVLIQRNPADQRDDALAAAMFGTDGGHVHSNGLAIELYGAGLVLAPDLGRGSSYWQDDHVDYYSQPPAHNTVIVDGCSNYPTYGEGHIPMILERVEPPPGQPGVSPQVSFARATFAYPAPASAQSRTLAIVRTSPTSGFYVDVFASRKLADGDSDSTADGGGYHDYLYHGLGQSLDLRTSSGERVPLAASSLLSFAEGNLKGYDYFKNESSASCAQDLHAVFSLDCGAGTRKRAMGLWMTGRDARRVFTVEGPVCWAARSRLPRGVADLPMPTLVVRQSGDAWQSPFVSVLEPHFEREGATIRNVRAAEVTTGSDGDLATPTVGMIVSGRLPAEQGAAELLAAIFIGRGTSDLEDAARRVQFECEFAYVLWIDGVIEELYLGHGRQLAVSELSVKAAGGEPISASFRRAAGGWRYSSTGEVDVRLTTAEAAIVVERRLPPGENRLFASPPSDEGGAGSERVP